MDRPRNFAVIPGTNHCMRIMLLAPQPFFQDRGTPIAVDMVLKVLSQRNVEVDVLTYHEGRSVTYPGVKIARISKIPFVSGIKPGLSWKKLVCDWLMVVQAIRMASDRKYQLVHAVEESVFIALLLKWLFRISYVYDMDSSLNQQIREKSFLLAPLAWLLGLFEGIAIRNALAVIPVCDALAENIAKYNHKKVVVLRDVSLLGEAIPQTNIDLRAELGISGKIVMYVGNLESYQGIDLLLESFALAITKSRDIHLVIVGGNPSDIEKYQKQCSSFEISKKVHFLGPRQIEDLSAYLSQADILVSPRVKGQNTPMKIFSYLHSGKPVLASRLPTHTQVLNDNIAMLAEPTAYGFCEKMVQLINDADLRSELGKSGRQLVEENYTFKEFQDSLNSLYAWLNSGSANASTAVVDR